MEREMSRSAMLQMDRDAPDDENTNGDGIFGQEGVEGGSVWLS
jgi:hypothetical protein